MKTAQLTATLLYYDGVQVFEGRDDSGSCYLGALVDSEPDADRYLITSVSLEHLRDLRSGTRDLRAVLLECSREAWYLARVGDGFASPFVLERQKGALLDHDYLPEDGVLLAEDGVEDAAIKQPVSRAF